MIFVRDFYDDELERIQFDDLYLKMYNYFNFYISDALRCMSECDR